MPNAGVAVYRNVFALIVEIDDYEGETRLQTKRATYEEIRAWVKRNYGLHVSNLATSRTKYFGDLKIFSFAWSFQRKPAAELEYASKSCG